jgi:hypothetical protein
MLYSFYIRPNVDPRVSSGTAAAYCQWMPTDVDKPAPYHKDSVKACSPMHRLHAATMARCRLGVHHLEVSKGRWNHVQRDKRLYWKCAKQHVEDEKHAMFEVLLVLGPA